MKKKLINFVLIILAAGGLGYGYNQKTTLDDYRANPQKIIAEESKRIKDKIAERYELPSYKETVDGKEVKKVEEPTIATVQDLAPLKDQEFFANAEIGDYVLVFQRAKTAMIYREKTDKVINFGPVDLNNKNVAKIKIIGTAAAIESAKQKINTAFPNSATFEATESSKPSDKTYVIDATGSSAQGVAQVVSALPGSAAGTKDQVTADISTEGFDLIILAN
jgi:hypothetical protein